MKHSKEDIEIIAKSLYKAVHKKLSTQKDVLDDFMDDDYVAETTEKVGPSKKASLWKEEKGVKKLKKFIEKTRK